MITLPPYTGFYLDYQIWDTEEGSLPIRIHRQGHRDHEESGNTFATVDEARAEARRRVSLRQQTGLLL